VYSKLVEFGGSITTPIPEGTMEARRRRLVEVENQNFKGWVCNECAWVFRPSGPLGGESIDEMKAHYIQQRDKEFASHVCEKYPKPTKNPG
jgi:hypothetical protein